MKVFKNLEDISPEFRGAFVAIGNFDGVHLGHKPIFQKLVQEAHLANRKSVVITFEPHPRKILCPEIQPFYLITTLEEKIGLMEVQGVDAVLIIPFSLEYSRLTAEEFIHQVLWDRLRIQKIFIGYDYAFGKNKAGNESLLRSIGKTLGFDVAQIEAVKIGDETVSSTRLRFAILDGSIRVAAGLLGRSYNVGGLVVRGKNRGTLLGFPTANIKPEKVLLPPQGVYAVMVHHGEKQYQGVLNIGCNPTFSNDECSVEVHLLDFTGDLYGKRLNVLFIDRIRDEVKFDSVESLIAQINRDIERAKAMLDENKNRM